MCSVGVVESLGFGVMCLERRKPENVSLKLEGRKPLSFTFSKKEETHRLGLVSNMSIPVIIKGKDSQETKTEPESCSLHTIVSSAMRLLYSSSHSIQLAMLFCVCHWVTAGVVSSLILCVCSFSLSNLKEKCMF